MGKRKITDSLQTEVDASYLYKKISEAETHPEIARVFLELSGIEHEHATHMLEKMQATGHDVLMPGPSGRARWLNRIGKVLGYEYVIGVLLDTEKSLAYQAGKARMASQMPSESADGNHVRILQSLMSGTQRVSGENLGRIEGRHRTIGGNALRAAVLGANDGLVSNMSLVMGVAGATGGDEAVLVAGMAGLLAGALSMSLGEWISVKSSQELYQRQMNLEWEELEVNPEGEQKEIALIYMAKGIPEEMARQMAADAMKDKNHAHEILVKEELGISPEELKGSPWEAALASFFLFISGAILPVLPYFWMKGNQAIMASMSLSVVGLFTIGAAITLFTGRSVWYSGFRQVLFGLVAAAITFGIGHLIGVSIS
jgi:VIT1/CCC1 family predicted Fe2+/Mn2+ transporter